MEIWTDGLNYFWLQNFVQRRLGALHFKMGKNLHFWNFFNVFDFGLKEGHYGWILTIFASPLLPL